jgi:hypothetical protein
VIPLMPTTRVRKIRTTIRHARGKGLGFPIGVSDQSEMWVTVSVPLQFRISKSSPLRCETLRIFWASEIVPDCPGVRTFPRRNARTSAKIAVLLTAHGRFNRGYGIPKYDTGVLKQFRMDAGQRIRFHEPTLPRDTAILLLQAFLAAEAGTLCQHGWRAEYCNVMAVLSRNILDEDIHHFCLTIRTSVSVFSLRLESGTKPCSSDLRKKWPKTIRIGRDGLK